MRKTTAKRRKKIDSSRRLVVEKQMLESGTGITEISLVLGVSHVAVISVIDGDRVMSWLRKKLAEYLLLDEGVLFGNDPRSFSRHNNQKKVG